MKLSIVLLGRNDDYCGDYIGRLRLCITSLQQSLGDFNWEIVLVDYNQVQNKPPLSEYFADVRNLNSVVVTRKQHIDFMKLHIKAGGFLYHLFDKNKNPVKGYRGIMIRQAMCGAYAANVGITQASGKYILFTTPDDIFPMGLKEIIKILQPKIMYRARKSPVIHQDAVENFDKIMNNEPFENTKKFKKPEYYWNNICKGTGDFLLMDKHSWKKIGGFLPIPQHFALRLDALAMFAAVSYGIRIGILNYTFKNIHDSTEHQNINEQRLIYRLQYKKHHVYDQHKAAIEVYEAGPFHRWASSKKFSKGNRCVKFRGKSNLKFFKRSRYLFRSFLGRRVIL